jgi:hypothetical protein
MTELFQNMRRIEAVRKNAREGNPFLVELYPKSHGFCARVARSRETNRVPKAGHSQLQDQRRAVVLSER